MQIVYIILGNRSKPKELGNIYLKIGLNLSLANLRHFRALLGVALYRHFSRT